MHKLLIIIGILSFLIQPATGYGETLDRIVAVVNDEIITLSEFTAMAEPVLREAQASLSPSEFLQQETVIKKQVLDAMIDERLMLHKAKELGLTVQDDEVNERIEDIKRENKIETDEQFNQVLLDEGLTLNELRDQMRIHITMLKLRAREVQYKIDVSEADARKYYQDRKSEFTKPRRAHVFLLLVEVSATASEQVKAEKRSVAQQLRQRLIAGEEFNLLVKEVMPQAADNGGDIGWLEEGKMLQEFQQLVFTLPIGSISEPFATDHGINLIKVVEREDETLVPFEQVQEAITNKIRQTRTEARMRDWLDDLRAKAFITKKDVL